MESKDRITELELENKKLKEELEEFRNNSGTDSTWYQNIIDSLPSPILVKNNRHQFVSMNNAFCEVVGKSRQELLNKTDFDFFDKEEAQVFWDKDSEVLASNKTSWNEEELTIDGEITKLLTAKVRIEDRKGNYYVLGILTDITDNKNHQILLQQKNDEIRGQKNNIETLLKEVHHRVKNNLQIISSMLSLQMNRFEDNGLLIGLSDSRNRIISMAKVHEILYKSGNFSEVNMKVYLTDLINSIIGSLSEEKKINFKGEFDNLFVSPEMATLLGLIVNEILTNSFKHFGDQEINLHAYANLYVEGDICHVQIGDNGPGNVDPAEEKVSIGLELIELFIEQLQADFRQVKKGLGTHYEINFGLKQ